jgi:hypothetical protein
MKKTYSQPKLTVHGTVESITQQGGSVVPRDLPTGPLGSAFPS